MDALKATMEEKFMANNPSKVLSLFYLLYFMVLICTVIITHESIN